MVSGHVWRPLGSLHAAFLRYSAAFRSRPRARPKPRHCRAALAAHFRGGQGSRSCLRLARTPRCVVRQCRQLLSLGPCPRHRSLGPRRSVCEDHSEVPAESKRMTRQSGCATCGYFADGPRAVCPECGHDWGDTGASDYQRTDRAWARDIANTCRNFARLWMIPTWFFVVLVTGLLIHMFLGGTWPFVSRIFDAIIYIFLTASSIWLIVYTVIVIGFARTNAVGASLLGPSGWIVAASGALFPWAVGAWFFRSYLRFFMGNTFFEAIYYFIVPTIVVIHCLSVELVIAQLRQLASKASYCSRKFEISLYLLAITLLVLGQIGLRRVGFAWYVDIALFSVTPATCVWLTARFTSIDALARFMMAQLERPLNNIERER